MNNIPEDDIGGIRKKFKELGIIIAGVDKQLRYQWIENPHPDFDAEKVIGKRDDELISQTEAEGIISFKKRVFKTGKMETITLLFDRTDGPHLYNMVGYPVRDSRGQITSIVTLGFHTKLPEF